MTKEPKKGTGSKLPDLAQLQTRDENRNPTREETKNNYWRSFRTLTDSDFLVSAAKSASLAAIRRRPSDQSAHSDSQPFGQQADLVKLVGKLFIYFTTR